MFKVQTGEVRLTPTCVGTLKKKGWFRSDFRDARSWETRSPIAIATPSRRRPFPDGAHCRLSRLTLFR
ncbi:hypothetical protein GCM10010412_101020 [Nonomuraea recticatena]|uniref:Uncharacterized protein n=1 Tax=Nonomuraea recticatena TaxID=46178 RepID=A0ABN3TGN2_9ACTN